MKQLKSRAEKMRAEGSSQITGGKPGEDPLNEWECNGIHLVHLPNDPQKILRISIGGGNNLPVALNYCVFRGDRQACVELLRKALEALEKGLSTED